MFIRTLIFNRVGQAPNADPAPQNQSCPASSTAKELGPLAYVALMVLNTGVTRLN